MFTKNKLSILYFISFLSMVWAMVKRDNACGELGNSPGVSDCQINDQGNVISVILRSAELTQDTVELVGNYTTIEKMGVLVTESENVMNFEPFSFLQNLTQVEINTDGIKPVTPGLLPSLVSVKSLDFTDIELNQENIEELSTLTDLEQLRIRHSSFDSTLDYNCLKNLTKLNELFMEAYEYHHNNDYKRLVQVPDFVFHLYKLTSLHIAAQDIEKFPVELIKLENIEYLDLSDNKIDDTLPDYLNTMSHLKTIVISGNVNIKGKVLTNDHLETCIYQESYDLCKPKEMDCLKNLNYQFADCKVEDGSDGEGDDEGYSTDGQCGDGHGKCPPGFCCSGHGWCGKTEDYCSLELGCQNQFGSCNDNTSGQTVDPEVSQNGRCGEGFGKCPNGQCCSKFGYCGVLDSQCLVAKGCQSNYGTCYEVKLTVDGSCGSQGGRCPIGYCCSQYGWCGKTSSYCDAGCQPLYGYCNQME